MELKQLRSFVAVVEKKSFTGAAETLYLSQPTVSMHVRQLEEEFGVKLISRSTKSIDLTERGAELYDFAASILSQCDRLTARWSEEARREVHLGVSTIPSAYVLPEVLPAYQARQPAIRFLINQSDSRGVLEGLKEERFDLGMVGMEEADEELSFLPFYRDEMVLITPDAPPYAAQRGKEAYPLEELLRSPFITREAGSGSEKCVEDYFVRLGVIPASLHVVARLNDLSSTIGLVESGMGVSIISGKAAERAVPKSRVLCFKLPRFKAERSLYLVHRRKSSLSPPIQDFIRFVQDYYR